jgi:alkaline phosphatase D
MPRPAALARALAPVLAAPVLFVLAAASPPAAAQDAPPPPTLTRVSFGSCADEEAPQPIWDAVLAYRPEIHVFAGDNVYGSAPREELREGLPVLRDAYEQALRLEPVRRLREAARTLAIWDDHDYGLNDAGADHPFRQDAKDLFLDFWEVGRDDPRRSREGLYAAETFGPEGRRIQVILLDTRWFRSPLARAPERLPTGPYVPTEDPAATLLGEAQWAWLEEQLRQPAEVRLVVSSIQVLAEGHNWERWGNFPAERRRLFDLIGSTGARGVVFLSGDRHVGAVYRAEEGVPYPLTEITSSGINRVFPGNDEPGPNRLGAVYGVANFGTVDVDWWARTLTLSLRGVNGEPVRREVVSLDALRPRDGG